MQSNRGIAIRHSRLDLITTQLEWDGSQPSFPDLQRAMAYPEGNRFSISVEGNHQAWLWVTAILSLMYSVVVLGTRITVKWGFFGADDLALREYNSSQAR